MEKNCFWYLVILVFKQIDQKRIQQITTKRPLEKGNFATQNKITNVYVVHVDQKSTLSPR